MKNLLIGIVIGVIFAGTGAYAYCVNKAKKIATKENAEKVIKASQQFGDSIKEILDQLLIMLFGKAGYLKMVIRFLFVFIRMYAPSVIV